MSGRPPFKEPTLDDFLVSEKLQTEDLLTDPRTSTRSKKWRATEAELELAFQTLLQNQRTALKEGSRPRHISVSNLLNEKHTVGGRTGRTQLYDSHRHWLPRIQDANEAADRLWSQHKPSRKTHTTSGLEKELRRVRAECKSAIAKIAGHKLSDYVAQMTSRSTQKILARNQELEHQITRLDEDIERLKRQNQLLRRRATTKK